MTNEERTLLLTVARLMLVKMGEELHGEQDEEFKILCKALTPFDPVGMNHGPGLSSTH